MATWMTLAYQEFRSAGGRVNMETTPPGEIPYNPLLEVVMTEGRKGMNGQRTSPRD